MSDFYIIGANRKIASITDGSVVCAVENAGTTRVYWRDATPEIKMSSSTDGITWTTPVTVWTVAAGFDIRPAGIVWTGSQYVMALAYITNSTGAVTTYLLGSANGTTFSTLGTVLWSEYWAHPTDLHWDGTYFYLAATVRVTFDGPLLVTYKTSNYQAITWASGGYPSQLTTTGLVWPRLAVVGGQVDLVFREGDHDLISYTDRILHASRVNGVWSPTSVVVYGTGNPDIAPLSVGYAVIYQDQSVQAGRGIWSWIYYNGENFVTRGTFAQNFEAGMGGWVLTTADGFTAYYATRTMDGSIDGTVYARHFTDVTDEPERSYQPISPETHSRKDPLVLDNFSLEISSGTSWVSLSDSRRFYTSAQDYGDKAQVLRRITAQSPFYEGTYLIHAVRENVTEMITIGILGSSQNEVTENMLLLEEMISQPSYRIRLTMGDHAETWQCQAADYTISRGHVMMHNVRAQMRISVPRLPNVSYEVY